MKRSRRMAALLSQTDVRNRVNTVAVLLLGRAFSSICVSRVVVGSDCSPACE